MKVLISGASGLVGQELCSLLEKEEHSVYKLSRTATSDNTIIWNPLKEFENPKLLENFDAVVHLAGENIASGRWNEQRKRRILDSRVLGTRNLVEAFSKVKNKPKVFIAASAIGIYGSRPGEVLNEESSLGDSFLANICKAWEKESSKIAKQEIRLVTLRIGVVLDPKGGALKKMLPIFKLGLGGPIASGKQMLSWIANKDLARMIYFAIQNENIKGTYNAVAPEVISNEEFTRVLARKLKRPAVFRVPGFLLKLIFGQMAEETVLGSSEVRGERILEAGFSFEFTDIFQL